MAFFKKNNSKTSYKMITTNSEGFYSYDGRLYKSELVRAAIRPQVMAIGKLIAKHVREIEKDGEKDIKVNPDVSIKFLLEEPNRFMTGQDMQEKLATQLALTGNAFALIVRNEMGVPCGLYPIPCTQVEMINEGSSMPYFKFRLTKSRELSVRSDDVIHIKNDYGGKYIFGENPAPILTGLMEMATVMDQGLIKAIKNSGIIRWLLKFNTSLRAEDIKTNVQEFVKSYLTYETDAMGAAGTDSKTDVQRIDPKDYVPNAALQDRVYERILNFFNTNKKIVQSSADEQEWNSYYEQVIEPIAMKLSNEFTRKLFTRGQRGHGNKIYFEAANLQHASLATKLNLREMVDRGALTPNEWRAAFNYAPVEGGNKPLRRKDTGLAIEEGGDE